ncbi:unnamed protein product, partial [Clonostachys rosea]
CLFALFGPLIFSALYLSSTLPITLEIRARLVALFVEYVFFAGDCGNTAGMCCRFCIICACPGPSAAESSTCASTDIACFCKGLGTSPASACIKTTCTLQNTLCMLTNTRFTHP